MPGARPGFLGEIASIETDPRYRPIIVRALKKLEKEVLDQRDLIGKTRGETILRETYVGGGAPTAGEGTATQVAYWISQFKLSSKGTFYFDTSNDRLGVGTGATISATVHALATTEQLRLGYDTSNYMSITAGSDGAIVLDATGATPSLETGTEISFGINRTPEDSYFEIQNSGVDYETIVLNLSPWAWWSADYITPSGSPYVDGDDLAGGAVTWFDRTPNNRDLLLTGAAASQVEYQTSTLGVDEFSTGMPALSFIDNGRGEFSGIQTLDSYTVFIVFKSTTATSQGSFLFRDNNGTANPGDFLRPPAASGGTGGTDDNWRQRTSDLGASRYFPGVNVTYTDTSYNVHVGSFNGGNGQHAMYLNGTTVGTSTDAGLIGDTLSFTRFRTVNGGSGTGLDNVFIAEVIVFSSVLSDSDRGTVTTYLNEKYGLNGASPSANRDYARYYNTDGDLLHWVDASAQVAISDVDYSAETLTSALTIQNADGDIFDMRTDGAFTMHWELTPPASSDKTITIPNKTGTLLLSTDIGTTVQAWDVDLDEIAAQNNVRGDILVTNSGPNWVRFAIGSASTLLKSDGTDPSWGTVNLLSAFHGDTTAGTVARGDLVTGQTGTPKWTRLALGASGTVLRSDGTDAAWASLSGAGIVAGSGTTNYLPKWTGATTLGNSSLSEDSFLITSEVDVQVQGQLLVGQPTLLAALDASLVSTNRIFQFPDEAGTFVTTAAASVQDVHFGDIFLKDDTSPSHYLQITDAENLSADRVLSLNVNDANRTVSLSGNLTVPSAATVSGINTGDHSFAADSGGTATGLAITLAGGNGLTSTRSTNTITYAVGAGAGISVAADSVAVDPAYTFSWTEDHSWTENGVNFIDDLDNAHQIYPEDSGSGVGLVIDSVTNTKLLIGGSPVCDVSATGITIEGGTYIQDNGTGARWPYILAFSLASDQSTASTHTSPVDLTGLVWTYEASSTYIFRFIGTVTPGAAATGVAFTLNVSGTVAQLNLIHLNPATANQAGYSIADDALGQASAGFPGTGEYTVAGWGILRTITAQTGTAQLRVRAEVDAIITVESGFTLVVEKVRG